MNLDLLPADPTAIRPNIDLIYLCRLFEGFKDGRVVSLTNVRLRDYKR